MTTATPSIQGFHMFWFVLIVFLTVFISANCSLYEAILYSTRQATLEGVKAQGRAPGLVDKMIHMKQNIASPIAAILILNTIANTAGATLSGMMAAEVLGAKWMPLVSVGLTLCILIFSEIIPKTVGAVHWRGLWRFTVLPLLTIRYLLTPFVFMAQRLTDILTPADAPPNVTEDDIVGVAWLGTSEGEISEEEGRLVENVIRLEDSQVHEVMTPRAVVFTLPEDAEVSDAYRHSEEKAFSRIPVYRDDPENIIGYVTRYDINTARDKSEDAETIAGLVKEIQFVPEKTDCLKALINLLSNHASMAIACDEFGGFAGLLSLEDILETLLGTEIVDETDKVVDLREYARRRRKRKL